ncbi:GntR family transcriptional regulator [Thiofilum flexile]|uniref:GntR family transcriptional regulator n=1 Tax=Thiofilum flexile TaxID=125627 RepID=UPI000367EEFD|nr:GntR family transcriptional regulator [Thiofilum flexile]
MQNLTNTTPLSADTLAANDSTWLIKQLQTQTDTALAEPIYRQLLRQIIQMIQAGRLLDGASLPSERTLAEALNLSRTTVRKCYDELRERNYISTHGRAGVVIKSPSRIAPEIGKLKGFTEEMHELGMEPSTRILAREVVQDRTIASIFGRPSTAPFLQLIRLRLADNVPMTREVAWYDLTLAPALERWNVVGSIYEYMQQHCGLVLEHAEQTMEAAMSNPDEMLAFDFDTPAPCLLLKRKTYTTTSHMIEYVEGTFRGDAYTYRINLKLNP